MHRIAHGIVLASTILQICFTAHAQENENSNKSKLTPPLKQSDNPRAGAGAGVAALGALGLGAPQTLSLTYGGWIAPANDPSSTQQHRVAIQAPVFRDETDTIALSVSGSSLHFDEPQTLSSSGTLVPMDLWRIECGGHYSRRLEKGKLIGGRVSFGSASNRLLADGSVTTIGANLFYGLPPDENSRWLLTLFFSNNNPIVNYVPIPGFVYLYQTKKFTGMFGLPFASMQWRPTNPWALSLSMFGPTVNFEAAHGDVGKIQAYAGFNWAQQSYLRYGRSERNDRLFFDEKRGQVGVRFPLFSWVSTDLQGGYAFDRSIYEGPRFGKKDRGSAGLGSSWFAAWNIKVY